MNSQNMRGTMPGQMANPMMVPNMMPNNGGMGGRMNMPDDYYMRRMQGPGTSPPAPSTGRGTTPSFVGMTRSQASAMAQQYGLVPAFDGANSEDAVVASQAPEPGALIFRTAMPIRFEMRARLSPSRTPAPEAPAPVTPTQATPTQATPTQAAPAAQPSTPTAPAKPAPARAVALPAPSPAAPSRNWWVLAVIAAALAAVLWLLFGKRKKPAGFNSPPAGGMAQLATQIVSTGLAEATVSLGGASAPRFELRYVVEHDPQADQIGISVGGGKDGG